MPTRSSRSAGDGAGIPLGRRFDRHVQAVRAAQPVVDQWPAIEDSEAGHSVGRRFQQCVHFQPSEMHSDADVFTPPEGEVVRGATGDIEARRVRIPAFVAV